MPDSVFINPAKIILLPEPIQQEILPRERISPD
jgi:hypothetical protein